MALAGESEAYVPRPGDVIEIRPDRDYWQFGRDEQQPNTWQRTVGFETDDGVALMWVNAHGADPFDQMRAGRQFELDREIDGQEETFGLVRDESGDLRVQALEPEPEPLDLTGAEPFRLRSGDQVVTNDRGVFSYHGIDNSGAERWHANFQDGISVEIPDAPFQPGEQTTVVRRRDGDELEFTVAKGDDGLVLVPGAEQPSIDDAPAGEQRVSGPATQTDAGERAYTAHTQASRKQAPSAGR
jgi:hypothetical protein